LFPSGAKAGDLACILANFEEVSQPADECRWQIALVIGKGAKAREVMIDLASFISWSDTSSQKRSQYFSAPRPLMGAKPLSFSVAADKQEVILLVKKLTYDEDTELARLRSAVANIDAAWNIQKAARCAAQFLTM
jgi:hypothetical protein